MTNTTRAATWMLGAIASFTTMAVAGRALSERLDTFEIMMYRSLLGLCIVLGILTLRGRLSEIKFRRLGLHATRNIAHFTAQNLWFFAIASSTPLAVVFALEFTSPIWAVLLAPLILAEPIRRKNLIAVSIAFMGVLVVTQPSPTSLTPGVITAFLSAIGFGITALFTRKLTRTESIASILFFLTAMQAVFGIAAAGYDGDITLPLAQHWPWVIAIAIAGLTAHFCLTTALSLAPASTVMPIDFLRLPIAAVIGALAYNEPITLALVAGAALILLGNWINLRQHR